MTQDDPPAMRFTSLSSERLPPATIDTLQNAIVAPVGPDGLFPCGVFRSDGSFCDPSRTFLSGNRFSTVPDLPTASSIRRLRGRFVFAGPGRNHFGHFLLESIARLWALDQIKYRIDGILFVDRPDSNFDATLAKTYLPFICALAPDMPIYITTDPVRVNKLIVPTQGIGHQNWITGTPEFRNFVRSRLEQAFTPDGPDKLYISRSKLKGADKLIHREERIEQLMEQAGYTLFHPEQHSIDVQCQRYLAARQVVGADGSAFHLAAFLLQPGTRVAVFQRRRRPKIFDAISQQLDTFGEIELTAINPLARPTSQAADGITPINLRKLRTSLANAGFI